MPRFRPTLGQVFLLAIAGLTTLLAFLLWLFAGASRDSILRSSGERRRELSEEIGAGVSAYLKQADKAVEHIENQVRFGACKAEDALSVEAHLFAEVLNNPDLAEIAFTHAARRGYLADGSPDIAP